ncbi:MAG: hypothetical protein AMJ58_12940 [Gammaproteobacteria bacterium SG8_30]|jgi:ribosomal protein L7/L12|nr:MAG: hypothetical protein AMJ58_12940 [Gammaproteobacteria bacterium SG8_30]
MTDREEQDGSLPAAAIVALNQGRFIDAIKLTREAEQGLGLAAAKERVEAYVAKDPMLKAQVEQQRAETRRRLVRWVLVIDVVIVAVLVWYFFLR